MRRRKHEEETDAADRWLISYADLLTLMFAFFVVMYSVTLQKQRYEQMSESVRNAMNNPESKAKETNPSDKTESEQSAESQLALSKDSTSTIKKNVEKEVEPPDPALEAIIEQLAERLSGMLKQGEARLRRTPYGVYVEIDAGILFEPAEANLSPSAQLAMRSVGDVLRQNKARIHVLGHTDSQDIRSNKFPSNWELSAARASSVVRLFAEAGVDPKRLVAIGYGSTQPVADNTTAQGRLRNRRVEIQIVTDNTLKK